MHRIASPNFTRRDALMLGAGAATFAALPVHSAAAAELDAAIRAFTGGAPAGRGIMTLTLPAIAENGYSVPVAVSAPGADAIAIFATDNPNPDVGTFTFGPLAGSNRAATRIRLARTQTIIAIARMGDGSYVQTSADVEVTVGGCGA